MWRDNHYVAMMSGKAKNWFTPCIPTRGTQVPSSPEWFHEVKQDGFRLIVQRDDDRVRLFTRNAYEWTAHYPLIVEAARRIETSQFVIDGEAVLLGVDGISDFDGLFGRFHAHGLDSRNEGSNIDFSLWRTALCRIVPAANGCEPEICST
jgi:ATP-dependent DNA ligase